MCIQVPLGQPLTTAIFIGKFYHKIQYEGISFLCYHCGRIGYLASQCSYNTPNNLLIQNTKKTTLLPNHTSHTTQEALSLHNQISPPSKNNIDSSTQSLPLLIITTSKINKLIVLYQHLTLHKICSHSYTFFPWNIRLAWSMGVGPVP